MATRRVSSQVFKLEAVKMVNGRGVSVAEAARVFALAALRAGGPTLGSRLDLPWMTRQSALWRSRSMVAAASNRLAGEASPVARRLESHVAGHDGGLLVAFGDDRMKVFIGWRSEGLETKVVDDEQRDARQGGKLALVAAGAGRYLGWQATRCSW